ncbi:WD40 repeat domain-containing protein [Phragmitibacter flavus]|uniref:WD40 repeat domain-containing protein n=1 Tax=Phragmitibacter flavus TaxID=2576071 RepID=A0A5R8K9H0_9BACT|nr:WD40 repeat domain-containing protein [Phragmitibacter flavus]TLD68966.1 WD40 repeat domain-containing protein [Phragmitibacter flavus]
MKAKPIRVAILSLLLTVLGIVSIFAAPPSPPQSAHQLLGIWRAHFNQDASTLVIQLRDGSIYLATTATGDLLPTEPPLSTIRGTVIPNTDGSQFAVTTPTHLQVFESTTGKALSPALAIETIEGNPTLVFSPDGRFLAALDSQHHAHLFDTSSWKKLATFPPAAEDTSADLEYQSPLLFSSNSQRLYFLSHTGHVQPIDTKTWKPHGPVLEHPNPDGYIFGQSLSPDDTQFITFDGPGENGPKGQLQLWNLTNSNPIGSPVSAQNGISGTFLDNPFRLIVTPSRGTATVRELPSFQTLFSLPAHDDVDGTKVQPTPDGKFLITSGSDTTLRLMDAKTGTQKSSIVLPDRPSTLLIEPDSKHLLTASTELIQNDQSQTWSTILTRLSIPELQSQATFKIASYIGLPILSTQGNHFIIIEGSTEEERLLILDTQTLAPLPWCANAR